MIDRIAERISGSIARQPKVFIIAFILMTVALLPGIFLLTKNVEPSLEKVLPKDVPEVKLMNDMRSQFGADMIYLILQTSELVPDARDPAILNYADALSQKIRTREHIIQVTSLADIVKQKNGVIPASLTETKELLNGTDAREFMNAAFSFAVIRIVSDTGASAHVIDQVVTAIEDDIDSLEAVNPGVTVLMTGNNAIDKATFEVIMSDFARITVIAFALVALVVFVTFRSIKRGIFPLIVVMVGVIWTMGIVGYLGLTITVVSMVAAAMIMGLGIDFGIHVVHRYAELREKKSPKKALHDTMTELFRAMLGASTTTTAGFLALLFGVLPAMKVLGIILGIGIMVTLIGAVFLLPAIVFMNDRGGTYA